MFVNKIVSLTIVAFSVFLMVKAINMLKRTAETKPVAPMKRLAILLVVLSISSRLCAQVGVEGYTDSIEQRLAEHLRVTAAGRANRLISAGLFAASGTLLTAGGATMLAQAAGAVSLEVTTSNTRPCPPRPMRSVRIVLRWASKCSGISQTMPGQPEWLAVLPPAYSASAPSSTAAICTAGS